ncbi:hypothetical protein [Flagellimonas ochracea]|nr:hypothetical protein [Allomuricauda ochracea]
MVWSQKDHYTVVAEQGDGIFSLLRKQGLDPVEHYVEFVELNKDDLRKGSQLQLGMSYKVPYSLDSFKKTGVRVDMVDGTETSLFEKELSKMSLKSNRLKNAVYYLLIENHVQENSGFLQQMTKKLAADLMVQGAQIYVLDMMNSITAQEDTVDIGTDKLGQCVDAVNKRYLKHNKKYQRVLLLRLKNAVDDSKMNLAFSHYQNSGDGQRFADNLQGVFKKHGINKRGEETEGSSIFEDKSTLFLAKNLLPTVTLLTLDNNSESINGEQLHIRVDNKRFAQLLGNGILKDYADLEIED